jgi:high affinity Mn2+ porin
VADPRRGDRGAVRAAVWPAVLFCALAAAGCSVEIGFQAPTNGQAAASGTDSAPKEQPPKDEQPEKKDEETPKGQNESAAKSPHHQPRTLWQALHAYCCCLRSHLNGTAPPDEKENGSKEKDKENGGKKENNNKENNNKESSNKKDAGGGEEGQKNPPAAGDEQKAGGAGGQTKPSGNGKGAATEKQGQPGEKNPPAAGDQEKVKNGKDKGNGEGDKDEKEKKDKDEEEKKDEEKKDEETWYSAHAQATLVTQKHGEFNSPYIGPHSLLPVEPARTSVTGTVFLDVRVWQDGGNSSELVFNPEVAGGLGFSGVQGVAGFPNGEITRVGTPEPTPYIARLFWRQTCCLGDETEKVEDEANQIAGTRPVDRLTLVVGKLAATDVVDDNRYSHDPRTQFLDWSIMYNSAWDYPANVRGYTYGIALDYNQKVWAWRYGIFAEPEVANGAPLDPRFVKANGQVTEWELRYTANGGPGKVRLLAYLNHAHMGDYREAIVAMPVNPNITLTERYRFKYGFGLNWEQELTRDLGVFSRLGWNDGHTESWAFTEVDRTAVLGLALKGRCWCRPDDVVGLAGVLNGISEDHRDYLAAGGLGFILGDGRLRYGPEEILETYYNFQVRKGIFVTAAFQEVNHPAYNVDRGPVSIGTLRVHLEY